MPSCPRESAIDLPRIGKPYRQRELAAEIDKLLRSEAVRRGADVCVDKTMPFDEICNAIVHAKEDD